MIADTASRRTRPLFLTNDEHEAVRELLFLAIGERETDETREERDARVKVYEDAIRKLDNPGLTPGVEDWIDTDLDDNEPGAWLSGPTIRFAGTDLHLYALRVADTGKYEGMQEATDEPMQQELDHVLDLVGSRAETTTVEGWDGEYVVYAIPTGD